MLYKILEVVDIILPHLIVIRRWVGGKPVFLLSNSQLVSHWIDFSSSCVNEIVTELT